MDNNPFAGSEYKETGAELIGEEVTPEPDKPRGFANPEVLARAQATRKANKETGTPVESFGDGSQSEPKKRGRKPGTANPVSSKSLDGIAEMLVGVHALLAFMSGFSDIAIDKDEGLTLAKGIAGLAEQYKIKVDGKASALMGLIYAIAVVYGPRAMLIRKEMQERNNGNVAAQ